MRLTRHLPRLIIAVAYAVMITVIALAVFGCGGKHASAFKGRQDPQLDVKLDEHGRVRELHAVGAKRATGSTRSETPKDAAAPSSSSINMDGVNGDVSGSWMPPKLDEALKQLAWLPKLGAVLLLAGGVLYFAMPLRRSWAVAVSVAGVLMIAAPVLIDRYAWLLLLAIAGGAVWVWREHRQAVAQDASAKLAKEGRPEAAIAVARVTNPVTDAAYRRRAKVVVAP